MSDEEQKGFKVQDRRRFSESGDVRPEYRDAAAEGTAPTQPTTSGATTHPQATTPAVDINFSAFIISLSTQALAHLGEIPNPIDRQTAVDLGAAKQLIDILGMLRDKTKGNLDKPETDLLDGLLYDLRIRYVERVRAEGQGT